jgi:hypothetical protein
MDERALAAWQRALVGALVDAEAPTQVRERLRAHPDAPHFTAMLDRLDDRGLAIAIALVARWSPDAAVRRAPT